MYVCGRGECFCGGGWEWLSLCGYVWVGGWMGA